MFTTPSLLRLAEHKALCTITLSGRVLDLGGDKNSEYLRFLQGHFTTTTLNMSDKARPDILHDLEHPLPLEDNEYNHALLMNVLEHVFEYRQLLEEAVRVIKPEGTVVILVPFLFPVHPSPHDYHRFTREALLRELGRLSLKDVVVEPLSGGVLRARYLLLDRLLPKLIRFSAFCTYRYLVEAFEHLLRVVSRLLGKQYAPDTYALGYLATARKR